MPIRWFTRGEIVKIAERMRELTASVEDNVRDAPTFKKYLGLASKRLAAEKDKRK